MLIIIVNLPNSVEMDSSPIMDDESPSESVVTNQAVIFSSQPMKNATPIARKAAVSIWEIGIIDCNNSMKAEDIIKRRRRIITRKRFRFSVDEVSINWY